jgi:hypothetical protein
MSPLLTKVPRTWTKQDDLLDLAVVGHMIHGHEMKSPELKQLMSQFPEWAYPIGWTAVYKAHRF